MATPQSVLLVDDERLAQRVYSDQLKSQGYLVTVAPSAEAAKAILREQRFDLLITDLILPGSDGLSLLAEAKRVDPRIEVIVITGLDLVEPAVRAIKSGASDYLIKPVPPEALAIAVERCLSTRAILDENKSLRTHLKLYETSQRLSSTLNREQLLPMALGAVAQECGTESAIMFERSGEGSWILAASLGPVARKGADVAAALFPHLDGWLALGEGTSREAHQLRIKLPHPFATLFTVTRDNDSPATLVCVFSDAPPTTSQLENAQFICSNFALSLHALGQMKRVEHLAYLDDLTHLYNTRYLQMVLDREIESGVPFSLLFMDLDHFKTVNDKHGHLVGSKVLIEVARVLRAAVRDNDVVVRYGGDEYVAVLQGIDSGIALKVAERIRRSIEQHHFLAREQSAIRATISIGLASFPEHAANKADILDLADRALYRGKRTSRNVIYVASKDSPPAPERGN